MDLDEYPAPTPREKQWLDGRVQDSMGCSYLGEDRRGRNRHKAGVC